jgi:acyl-homoserine-lactone acylase
VFRSNDNDRSLIPRHQYPQLEGSQISAQAGGYHVTYGSSWMMFVQFTPEGPQARGLMTYSQSTDPRSEQRDDQTFLYSQQPQLRPLYFRETQIADHTQSQIQVQYQAH